MAEPILSRLGQRMRERTQPLAPDDANYGYAHAHLCEGMMMPFYQLAELVDPPDPYPPWAPLFFVDITPSWALPWLGQIFGVRIAASTSPDDARLMIKEMTASKRGGPGAIRAAAQLGLTGTRSVFFRERDGSAYELEVVTLASETPDLELVRRNIMLQKPGGIILRLRTSAGWDYQEAKTPGETYASLRTKYPTYRDLALGPPPVSVE